MKKWVIILVISLFILTSVYFAVRRARQLTAQTFDIDSLDIDKNTISVSGFEGNLNLVVSNFVKRGYKIDNINIELYSLDGTLIGYQTEPLKEPIEIQGNGNTIISIPMKFKANFPVKIYEQLKDKYNSVLDVINHYKETGHFGTEIEVKGFVILKGNKVNFDIKHTV